MSGAYVVVELWLGRCVGGRRGVQAKLVDENLKDKEERGWVGIMRILYLKLLRYFAPSFWTEDLFSRYPTILIHEIEPAFHNIESGICQRRTPQIRLGFLRKVNVPISNW